MAEIELSEVIRGLRAELDQAMSAGEGERVQFEATAIEMEFQVGVTKTADVKAGVRFWVFEIGGGGSRANESLQRVKLSLEPVLATGGRVKIAKRRAEDPITGRSDDA